MPDGTPDAPAAPVSAPAADAAPVPAAAPDVAPVPGFAPPTFPPPTAPGALAVADGPAPAPAPKKPRRIGWIIGIVLLAIALIVTGVFLILSLARLSEARDLIDDQRQEIDEQRELIEKKETFSKAAEELQATAAQFDGLPYATIVDTDYYASLITRAWTNRWDGASLDLDTADVQEATAELAGVWSAAQEQAAGNATGTFYESITDQLGTGFVRTSLDTADATCSKDVWGCVGGSDPFTIHYDQSQTAGEPYMNDWLRTGLAYHEYAHVLQMTNPGPTETAAAAFGGDWETMADCYALTFLNGWTLNHTIWVSSYQYWEVSVGYGYTCTPDQAQVVRDWASQVGYTHAPLSQ